MAGSRKRKDTVQSNTLFGYFANPLKRTRRDATPNLNHSSTTEQEDVIVISDEEKREQDVAVSEPLIIVSQPDNSRRESEQGLNGDLAYSRVPAELPPSHFGEWALGDDETLAEEDEEEEEEEERENEVESKVELCQGNYEANNTICPICNMSLKALFISEVERHVNRCLESCIPDQIEDVEMLAAQIHPNATASGSSRQEPKVTSAFSVLMTSHQENTVWKETTEAENKKGNIRGRRPAPFYKVMPGMPIAVDAFRYGKIPEVTAYFLTHAHSDHYTNLSSSWKHGPVYCSQTTANLIIHMLKVDPKWVQPLPMDIPTIIPDTGGVTVTLIQANHCPGSVLFLFEGLQTVNAGDSTFKSSSVGSSRIFRYLHCGDFRACPQHILHPHVMGKRVDTVYLDTTYLDPKYGFPPQPLVISACAELARRIVQGGRLPDQGSSSEAGQRGALTGWLTTSDKGNGKAQPEDPTAGKRVLVVVGTYTIGKERIVKAIAKALSTKIFCDARKTAIMQCLSDPELHCLLTNDPFEADVHVVPLHMVSSDKFHEYFSRWNGHWTKAVGFRPTGWTYTSPSSSGTLLSIPHIISRDQGLTYTYANLRPMKSSTPTLMLYGVPYSEHSSFFELTCFALSLNWTKMIATVNIHSAKSRGKMEQWFEKWKAEREKRLKADEAHIIVQYRALDHW